MTQEKSYWLRIIEDIRFWIVLFFLVRLISITDAPIEPAHNWRQTTVTMVARNFQEVSPDIRFPRVDFAGNKSGITPMEFPVFNYAIFIVSEVFGYQHWYGRLINLIISSIGLWYFFQLILLFFDKKTAFYSTFILALSVWFVFSRKIMPDTFSTSFVLMGMYYTVGLLRRKKLIKDFILGFLFLSIGILSKLPSAYLLVLLVPLFFKFRGNIKGIFLATGLLILAAPAVYYWYFVWNPYLLETYQFDHFFLGKSISQGAGELLTHWKDLLKRFYDNALKYVGFGLFLIGLIFSIIRKNKKLILVYSLASLGFLVIMLKAGETFTHHSYYIIPFAPVMALVAGFGVQEIKIKWLVTLLLFGYATENILNHQDDFRIKESHQNLVQLEHDLDRLSRKSDLIIINSAPTPSPMYFAHRKGWIVTNKQLETKFFLNTLEQNGAKYLVVLKRAFAEEPNLDYSRFNIILENKDYKIIQLS